MTNQVELRERTKQFAIRIVRLFRSLPSSPDAQVIGKQLLRAGTSVGANYRAVCRSRSHSEWLARLGVVVEEADESVFWLELLTETAVFKSSKVEPLLGEARQLTAIFTAAQRTGKQRRS